MLNNLAILFTNGLLVYILYRAYRRERARDRDDRSGRL